jgi:hypothetical protein
MVNVALTTGHSQMHGKKLLSVRCSRKDVKIWNTRKDVKIWNTRN